MRAMIFAAGLGTRLLPLTADRPKALVEVGGLPLLEIAIRRLKFFGVQEIVVNVHHFADQIEAFLRARRNFGIQIAISDERRLLLDTGGGLRAAASFFRDDDTPFFAVNTDVLTDLDFGALYEAHQASQALATLAVRQRPTSRYLLFDEDLLLCGWRNQKTGAERHCRPASATQALAFSGVQVLSPAIFSLMPADREVFSIIDVYLEAGRTHAIRGWVHQSGFWLDVGKLPALEQAEQLAPRLTLAGR